MSEEQRVIDDNRCLANGCRCLYTINGHLCQRCYWQRNGRVHGGWFGASPVDPVSIEPEPEPEPIIFEIHPGWHDLLIVAKCRGLVARSQALEASRRVTR
jgi:hypothetical protein